MKQSIEEIVFFTGVGAIGLCTIVAIVMVIKKVVGI